MQSAPAADPSPRARLAHHGLTALVVYASAAVLVVELTALRLLAPYLGLTLETSTLVIGLALTAIATGSWAGGVLADRVSPDRLLAPALAVSGVVTAATPGVVRAAAAVDGTILLLAAAVTIGVPGAMLSAVTPIVTKIRLTTLTETGTVVGSLSGISSLGAIAGTVLTGFVLVSHVPISGILVGLGVSLVVLAAVVAVGRRALPVGVGPVGVGAALLAAAALTVAVEGACDVETTYHCAAVTTDDEDPSVRTLVLDGLRHSAVDVDDPTHLEFPYMTALAATAEAVLETTGGDASVVHLGAGGMTLPRYLEARYPETSHLVVEVDQGVVDLARSDLGPAPQAEVVVGDARLALPTLDRGGTQLVVGDAFGGISPPWHLTTVEALRDVAAALGPGGTYAANIIDYGPLAFARAEVATMAEVFEHVVLFSATTTLDGVVDAPGDGGNLVAVGSDEPVATAQIADRLAVGWSALSGDDLRRWYADAPVLTDDYAPVDQLISQR